MEHTAYIALGSNIEPRAATLMAALKLLDEHEGISMGRISQFISTEAVGPPDQDDYRNGAAHVATSLDPEGLLAALGEVEADLGRDRSEEQRWGPRTCDLDLLLFDDIVIDTDTLTLPHPRMHRRAFVLEPLAEIAPEARHPALGRVAREMLDPAAAPHHGGS